MSYSVLIVEDEPVLARNICVYLERQGLSCQIAESGEQGLALLDEMRPDVVVLDHNLPGKQGLEVLKQIREREPKLPVIMATGHGSEQVAVDAMKNGAVDYLIKPVSLHQLKQALDRAMQSQRQTQELQHLRRSVDGVPAAAQGLQALVGNSAAMQKLRGRLRQILDAEARLSDGPSPAVLILGDTGTGKELVARALHFDGPRRAGPFVEINCASLPSQLVEGELFGHERGAFTDARERRIGLVEAAHGGTLFLDEIGELELPTQAKLLKLLEDRSMRRLGSVRQTQVDIRVLAATNRRLEELVQAGQFRSDLYFRLNTVRVDLPPLNAREGDQALLAQHFLARFARRYGKPELHFADAALRALQTYAWPGNVRELANVVEQCVMLAQDAVIEVDDLGLPVAPDASLAAQWRTQTTPQPESLQDVERRLLLDALQRNHWNVTHAARALGVSRDTLRYRIEKFGLREP